MRELSPNCDECVGAVGARESEIHEGDVRTMAAKLPRRFNSVGRLSDQYHVRLRSKYCAEPLAKNRVVFDAQNSNLVRSTHC